MKIILASTSPYRKELLERLQIPFTSRNPEVDETLLKKEISNPEDLAIGLAELKAKNAIKNESEITIGSDQVLNLEGEILGKPGNKEKAIEQLLKMQGKEHTLITAVCVTDSLKTKTFISKAHMKMRRLDIDAITRYVERDTPFNCAGSYKLESLGISLFESINVDDATGIVGLPLVKLSEFLRQWGYNIP
ncbi:MAG: nucleoside triphosphate pyrophosphatase [Bdellovibrionota bacterium]|nr:nucleoside triphosphate pyrophosphatase [Bdellovibrionota bacterium]